MYGYFCDSYNDVTEEIIPEKCEEYEQLVAKYPEHEIYLFSGTDVDMALFFAPGCSAMLIETRASPDKFF